MDRTSIALLAAGVGLPALLSTATADCSDLLPVHPPMTKQRPITALDLLGVRDIGRRDEALLGNKSPLGLSPDGRQLAFILIRAHASTNSYCIGLAVMDVKGSVKPRLLDQGGEFIGGTGDYRGVILPMGFPILLAPSWSPDGRWMAFLRRDKGVTQLWTVRADGGPARAVTHSPVDVEQFARGPDGRSLIYASRTGQLAERTALAREAVTGFRYDDRYVPMMGDKTSPCRSPRHPFPCFASIRVEERPGPAKKVTGRCWAPIRSAMKFFRFRRGLMMGAWFGPSMSPPIRPAHGRWPCPLQLA